MSDQFNIPMTIPMTIRQIIFVKAAMQHYKSFLQSKQEFGENTPRIKAMLERTDEILALTSHGIKLYEANENN